MRYLTRKNIRLLLLTLLGLACFIAVSFKGNRQGPFFTIGTLQIPSSTMNGIFTGMMSLICILLILTDYKKGFKIAISI